MNQGIFTEYRLTGEPRAFWKDCRVGIGNAAMKVCGATTPQQTAALFPGDCAHPTDTWQFCTKRLVPCVVCRALNVADALGLEGMEVDECDLADDHQLNGSCS